MHMVHWAFCSVLGVEAGGLRESMKLEGRAQGTGHWSSLASGRLPEVTDMQEGLVSTLHRPLPVLLGLEGP